MEPIVSGMNRLCIVSGYASSAMAFHHLSKIKDSYNEVNVDLIVGMCSSDGVTLSNHRGFTELVLNQFPSNFKCYYLFDSPAVHSKSYVWMKGDSPEIGYVGSANYTQNAFFTQRELMASADPVKLNDYYSSLISSTIICINNEAENYIRIYQDEYLRSRVAEIEKAKNAHPNLPTHLLGLPSIRFSLLDRHGALPQRSGLNWGQRPEVRREPNQAYIRLESSVYRSDFFPPRGIHFTVLTDDNKVLICTRAQANGKAIHTPRNNSHIGEYFRRRLGVPFGQPITKEHLAIYGRYHIDFYRIDHETYFMDFSESRDSDAEC